MNISDVRNSLIPLLKAHTGRPVIEADQGGEVPDGEHVVYKFTTPYAKEIGMPNVRYSGSSDLDKTQAEEYRITLSLTAIAEDNDISMNLAQSLRDWFTFYGQEIMQGLGIAAVTIGDINNRDSVNDDETRQGFDISLRITREISRKMDYYNKVAIKKV